MNVQYSSGWPALAFALLLALLLLGAYLNRASLKRLLDWWKGLDSRVTGRAFDPGLAPPDEVAPLETTEGGGRASRAHLEKKEAPLHRTSPHVERKTPFRRKDA